MVTSSLDGTVAVVSLPSSAPSGETVEEPVVTRLSHGGGGDSGSGTPAAGVTDFDVVDLLDLLVTAGADGAVVLWQAKSGKELRRLNQGEWICKVLHESAIRQSFPLGK